MALIEGANWAMYRGDCVELIDRLPDDSVGLSVFSPPFPGMYAYTDSERDMGNVKDIDEMVNHFYFLAKEDKLFRVVAPGRRVCVHITQSPMYKYWDGHIGLRDFRGKLIEQMTGIGWVYYGEVTIDKCPQLKAQRTKDSTLAMRSFCTDSSVLRPALADYVLFFMKPGENQDPILAGTHDKYPDADGWLTPEEWIEWAHPVWYDIKESDVLSARPAKDGDDEKHLCPLQLEVIERCVKLWSNPGDIVLSPFAGIGSEGYQSILLNRRFIGFELKKKYFEVACDNLRYAEAKYKEDHRTLFDAVS